MPPPPTPPDARYWLGQLAHAQGDETAATAYWQRAAAQNHAGAMRELGNQQARRGDQQNARDWWYRAAETRPPDAQAMYHLGQSLLAENREATRHWWQQASEHGHGWASWYLASSYAMPDALGLPQDGAQAWQYARRAAEQGNRDAAKLLMALAAASCDTPHAYAHPQSPHDQPINHWHARYQDENHWRQAARIAPLASLPANARPTNTTTPPQRLIPDPLPQEYRAAETAAHTVAARYWQHHAAAGDAEAQYQLGQHYAFGAGVPLDPAPPAPGTAKPPDKNTPARKPRSACSPNTDNKNPTPSLTGRATGGKKPPHKAKPTHKTGSAKSPPKPKTTASPRTGTAAPPLAVTTSPCATSPTATATATATPTTAPPSAITGKHKPYRDTTPTRKPCTGWAHATATPVPTPPP